jgi:multiple sugar transport system ATP-binding protein
MSAITLSGISKHFGSVVALREMDLKIGDKEFVALLGPSGCGKTTTMNIISGVEAPTSGRVRFDDADVTDMPIGRRGIGFVFQNYAIFTHMSVRQNLAYGLRVRKLPQAEIDRRVHQVAELLGITAFLDRPCTKLSVNILQRLAIGRSAAVEPAIFLLDEPLSNVDAAFRAVMRTELRDLQRTLGQTMVYVTHDQLEAMSMADRIAVMDHGRLLQVGTPVEFYSRPLNTFVAQFMGSPSMNLLKARLAGDSDRPVAELGALGTLSDLPTTARASASQDILLGVRPEDIAITAPDCGTLVMEVNFVERIGARTIVHAGPPGAEIKIVEGNGFPVAIGDRVGLVPDPARIRLFDAGSGQAVGVA